MNRLLILPLVFVLGGAPAAAVVCDLVLCADPAKPSAAPTGCHDHALPQSGRRLSTRTDDCSHISPVDPYVAFASRLVLQPGSSVPVALLSHATMTFRYEVDPTPAHGPPNSSHAASSLPLRI